MARLKAAVLISGRGSNLQALIDECRRADAAAEIVLVISNVAGAAGLARATDALRSAQGATNGSVSAPPSPLR